MNSAELILTEPVLPPTPLEHLDESKFSSVSDGKKKQIARDFESLLLGKLLDSMKTTIGDWGIEKDAASGQVQGIFWLYLARDIADNGGTGLWKDIYQFLASADRANTAGKSVDGHV